MKFFGKIIIPVVASVMAGSAICVSAAVREVDVCVYGGTSAGVIAAYSTAMSGKSVVLVEPGAHLGACRRAVSVTPISATSLWSPDSHAISTAVSAAIMVSLSSGCSSLRWPMRFCSNLVINKTYIIRYDDEEESIGSGSCLDRRCRHGRMVGMALCHGPHITATMSGCISLPDRRRCCGRFPVRRLWATE